MTTTFPVDGLTEIEPYGLLTETPALGPTLTRNSLRLSASSVPASNAPMVISWMARTFMGTLLARSLMKTRPLIKTPPNAPVGPPSARLAARNAYIMAKNDPWPTRKAWPFADTPPSASGVLPHRWDWRRLRFLHPGCIG